MARPIEWTTEKIINLKSNPNNPRIIKDDKFHKLVKSIKDFPEMLEIRPIVVNSEMIVLGGNMRLKAAKEAGLKEVPIIKAENLTIEQQNEFIIKDNVSGLIKGNAKLYVKQIFRDIESIGYIAQMFSINSASLGVPQMRQRVFIIGHKKEYVLPKMKLDFNEPKISFEQATKEFWGMGGESIERFAIFKQWKEIKYPKENSHIKRFSLVRPFLDKPCNTLTEAASNNSAASVCHPLYPRKLNKFEASVLQSYPLDYNFLDQNPLSCIGRSVPPVMIAQIANQIKIQWLDKI